VWAISQPGLSGPSSRGRFLPSVHVSLLIRLPASSTPPRRSIFKKFTKYLNVVFPARDALKFIGEYQRLAEINVLAEKHFRDGRLSMRGIPAKPRAITDVFLKSRGVQVKVEPISILGKDFQNEVRSHTRTKTRAAEIEHAIRHHLDVELDDDSDLQASFAEALKRIFEDFRNNWGRSTKNWENSASGSSTLTRNRPTGFTERRRCRSSVC
jgi:hypothetical protein